MTSDQNMTLAEKMQYWEQLKLIMNDLEQDIANEVLQLGCTQTVGRCRATYSKGRGTTNYDAALDDLRKLQLLPEELIKKYTVVLAPRLDKVQLLKDKFYQDPDVAEELKAIKDTYYTPGGNPKVTIKLRKEEK